LIRNYNEFKRLRRVNTREICPRVGQVSIQVMKRKRNAEEDGLQFLESERWRGQRCKSHKQLKKKWSDKRHELGER